MCYAQAVGGARASSEQAKTAKYLNNLLVPVPCYLPKLKNWRLFAIVATGEFIEGFSQLGITGCLFESSAVMLLGFLMSVPTRKARNT